MNHLRLLLILLGSLLLTAGCQGNNMVRDVTAAPADGVAESQPGHTIGQTFVARHAGLNRVGVYLSKVQLTSPVTMTLKLSQINGLVTQELRVASMVIPTGEAPGWRYFLFDSLGNSHNQSFSISISIELPAGSHLQLATSTADTYHDGALYRDNNAEDAQLPLDLGYDFIDIFVDLLSWFITMLGWLVPVTLLLVVPGLALHVLLLPALEEGWKVKLAVALGLGLSLYPLIFVWARIVGFGSTSIAVVGVLFVSLAVLVIHAWHTRVWCRWPVKFRTFWRSPACAPDLLWFGLAGVVVLTRMFLLRSLDAPMWGDSVQHAMIGQLAVDHGGLFESWLPYAPYDTLTVHPGFYVLTTLVTWLTGQSVLQSTLLSGQLANILAVITLTPLAQRMVRSRWAGVGVVLAAGLLSPLPNGFVNWGRYPQLLGQAILPVAIWLVWKLVDGSSRLNWRLALSCAISIAGSFLCYYRTPHAIVLFTLIVIAFQFSRLRADMRRWRHLLSGLIVTLAFALVLVSPWLVRLTGSSLGEGADASHAGVTDLQTLWNDYQVFALSPSLLSTALVAACVAIIVGSVKARNRCVWVVATWGSGLALLPMLRLLPVPGVNNLQAFAALVGLYIPIGLLVGYGIDYALDWFAHTHHQYLAVAYLALGAVALLGANARVSAIDPNYRILAPADLRAFAWIKVNTPKDSLFLVNAFPIYDGRSAVGSDGGWWIPLLAERRNTMPPQYPLLVERSANPAYNQMVVDLANGLRKTGVTSPAGLEMLCRFHITHVYIGQEQGRIGIPPPQPMLSAAELDASSAFDPIYRQDKVRIYQFHESLCH